MGPGGQNTWFHYVNKSKKYRYKQSNIYLIKVKAAPSKSYSSEITAVCSVENTQVSKVESTNQLYCKKVM